MEPAKADSKYETGQLFLHKIFGYRGVVLFPWKARVYDRDLHNPNKQKTPAAAAAQTTTNIPNAGGANVARGKTPGAADKVETAGACKLTRRMVYVNLFIGFHVLCSH